MCAGAKQRSSKVELEGKRITGHGDGDSSETWTIEQAVLVA